VTRRLAWLAGYGVTAGATLLAGAIGWAGIGIPVPVFVTAAGALAMGISLLVLTFFVMPPGRLLVGILGAGAGAFLVLYGWGMSMAPPDVDAAGGAVVVAGLAGIGITVLAAFGMVARPIGALGGLALVAALVTAVVGSSATTVGVFPSALAAGGLLAVAVWGAATGKRASGRRRLSAPEPAPGTLAASWRRPFPDVVPWAARIAGFGLLVVVASAWARSIDPRADAVQQGAELVAGGAIALLIWSIERAARGLGRARLSGIWELVGIVLPIGMGALTFSGTVLLAWVGPLVTSNGSTSVTELDGLAAFCLTLVMARLAWLLRDGPRRLGVLLGAAGVISALQVARPSTAGSPSDIALATLGVVTVLAGIWLVRVADVLRGRAPIDVLRTPAGIDPTARPPEPAPATAGAKAAAGSKATAGAAVAGVAASARPRARDTAGSARPAPTAPRPRRATRRGEGRRSFPRVRRSPRFDAAELARRLGVTIAELRGAQPRYRELRISKRTGGLRTLHAPDPPTLVLQRRIHRRLLAKLPVHDAAHGFERGRSIVTNAAPHAARPVILKLDLADFFGRTRASRVRRYWRVLGWDKEAAAILTRLTTLDGGLPQGAPTSPRIANLVNVRLDARLAGIARTLGATYTRYADDLTFSFPEDDGDRVRDLLRVVRRILWHEARYEIQRAKRLQVRRSWERQLITGLVVNQRPRLPRETRRWLRAVEHRTYSGGQPTITREQLRGWQALESMIDRAAEGQAPAP
jgi:hypothetical protein